MNFGHGYSQRSKYGAKKTWVNGIQFDSAKEAARYKELLLLQRAGKIFGLALQQRYEIVPEHREPDTIGPRGGKKKGKMIEPARYYVADFVYVTPEGELVVEDVKGYRDGQAYNLFKLKKALMFDRYGIRVKEI